MSKQLPLDELSSVIARVKGLLLTEEKVDRAVQLLAAAAKQAIPGTLGAGISLLDTQGRRTSSAATDKIVERADTAQYELGQGPCLTAWASEATILVEDVQTETRWPEWCAAMKDLPIRSVLSTPLTAGKESLGALKIYAAQPGIYDGETSRLLQLFAGPAATLLANVQSSETPRRISNSLETALYSRDTVARATGILMERHGLSSDDAMQELLSRVRTDRTTLLEECSRIIAAIPGRRG
ncbi:GAF and ANTAR domain-containing protein [Arthrobacter sp.]|uniref:GAF and ANTAR domain-containing protein n=1 Tax=Arthrobacter sp. TaxID=1667 RepID=UPI002810C207|nr:GAF and ANTAR domain-containing protein [Arthrobacter sp.]